MDLSRATAMDRRVGRRFSLRIGVFKGINSIGRGGGIRTPDPLLPKQMRYQTALRPDRWIQLPVLLTERGKSSAGTALAQRSASSFSIVS